MINNQSNTATTIPCPECDNPIEIKEVKLGSIVECLACGTESEIVVLSPLKLSPLEEEK